MFGVLDSVDSTNNYAMGLVQAGVARHGDGWFARDQFSGKGQRGKVWKSTPDTNILLSILVNPSAFFQKYPPLFNMAVATFVASFIQKETKESFFVKWPNDLYWNDRKAGGILIENRITGNDWNWAVIGIGINVNQTRFPAGLPNPVSLCKIKSRHWNPEALARKLHKQLVNHLDLKFSEKAVWKAYNDFLYKKGKEVRLKKGNAHFFTTIDGVDAAGRLHTHDVMERVFEFGSVEWIIEPHNLIS